MQEQGDYPTPAQEREMEAYDKFRGKYAKRLPDIGGDPPQAGWPGTSRGAMHGPPTGGCRKKEEDVKFAMHQFYRLAEELGDLGSWSDYGDLGEVGLALLKNLRIQRAAMVVHSYLESDVSFCDGG